LLLGAWRELSLEIWRELSLEIWRELSLEIWRELGQGVAGFAKSHYMHRLNSRVPVGNCE